MKDDLMEVCVCVCSGSQEGAPVVLVMLWMDGAVAA